MNGAVVIGVGNPDRGDDAVGLEVARRLSAGATPQVSVVERDGDPAGLFEAWEGCGLAVLVDAASSGGAPGAVRRFEAHRAPLPASLRHASTHSFGPAEAVELARALDRLPAEVIVYAVEGHRYGPGRRLSPAVEAAIPELVARIREDLRRFGTAGRKEARHA